MTAFARGRIGVSVEPAGSLAMVYAVGQFVGRLTVLPLLAVPALRTARRLREVLR